MLKKIAGGLFGEIVHPYMDYFDGLRQGMKSANISSTLEEYLSMLFLFSFVSFSAVLILSAAFVTFFVTYMSGAEALIYAYTLCVIISFGAAAATFFAGYYYPFLKAKSLRSRIERALPFAVFYMTTSASSRVTPLEIFRMLSMRGGVIGEEARRVYNDVRTLGMNLTDSLQKLAARTPSPLFSDLLWGMISVMTTGGDMEDYLNSKTRAFMAQYRRQLDEYSKQVAIYTEIYITAAVVGTLFFIVLIAIISPLMGFSSLLIQTFLVFLLVPLISIGFIVLIRGISPTQ
jgi:flagellar protein FlaJ